MTILHQKILGFWKFAPNFVSKFQIWSLSTYKCYYTFVEEHARHGIFKNISQGVLQVHVDAYNRLFSCGADGSMKVRQLPDRDFIVSAI